VLTDIRRPSRAGVAGVVQASLAILLAVAPVTARGQDTPTRAGQLRDEREDKATHLTPPAPGRLERVLLALEDGRLFERVLNPPEGLYPKIGTITPGGGFSGGPAYRRAGLLGERADFSAVALGSTKRYWLIDARLMVPRLADGRVFAEVHGRHTDFTQEPFFGLGPNSDRSRASLYDLGATDIGASGGFKINPWLSLGASVSHLAPRVRAIDHERSLELLFDPATVPGFSTEANFVKSRAFVDLNYREPRGNPRAGGRYLLSVERYASNNDARYTFNRFEADLQQYISLLRNRRVIALRGFVSMTDPTGGADVPFYLQRTLGGPDDLRGFRRFRFRDRHLLLLQAEYRWEIFTAVDGAIFYDAGQVASRPGDIDFSNLESDYGIGFRFGTANGVFLRVEGAFGSSGGKHFVLRLGHVF
jgi:outer membrane protein assembly factor BamA